MERALLVGFGGRGEALLGDLLKQAGPIAPEEATDEAAARAALSGAALLIVNAASEGPEGEALAGEAAACSPAGVLLLCRAPSPERARRLCAAGVLLVEKPIVKPLFLQAARDALAARNRLNNLKSENARLQYKLDEARVVSRAKSALIQYLDMSEAQAHRFIEKQAMDLRVSRMEVAKNVLKNYEL